MFDLLEGVNWAEYYSLLFDGHPSMFSQFAIFNAVVLAIWSFRKIRKARPMPRTSVKTYKGLFVVINTMILFQDALHLRHAADIVFS